MIYWSGVVNKLATSAYSMNGCGHVNVDPHTGPVEAEMTLDEEPSARRCGIVPVRDGILHVRHGALEFAKMQFRRKDERKVQVALEKKFTRKTFE